MKNLKRPCTFEEQIETLKSHNMIVEDDIHAEDVLGKINYYRLSGYALDYRVCPDQSDYIDNTSFEQVYQIYEFDRNMRNLLLRYVEVAEIYYRTQISYGFSVTKCLEPPHDQHYDENNYYNKEGFNEIISSFRREKERYKDSLIVKHHKAKYNGRMPLWVIVDLLSFSNLSKLYSTMYLSEKRTIADAVGTGHKTLTNHLHCLSVLRNKCAHAARLYDSTFYPKARFSRSFLEKTGVKSDSLFSYIVVLYRRLPDQDTKNIFLANLLNLLNRYKNIVNLSKMGFVENWVSILIN